MKSRLLSILILALTACAARGEPATMPAGGEATPARIRAAERVAAGRLLAANVKDDEHKAMVLTALLCAAPDLDMPTLLPSAVPMAERIAQVVAIEPKDMRTAAWQIQALSLLPDRTETRTALERATRELMREIEGGKSTKTPGATAMSAEDLFLAASALQVAADNAMDVPADAWKEMEKVTAAPEPAGGRHPGTGPAMPAVEMMTLRQAAAMAVTTMRVFDALHADLRKPAEEEAAVAAVMARVAALYKLRPFAGNAVLGLSDLLLYTGQQRLAGAAWQAGMNEELLAAQQADGSWPAMNWDTAADAGAESTATAVLVLARINAPVVISKFSYDGNWNGRPRDVANITAWLSDSMDRPLRWQVVSVADDAATWDAAPILFMTGKDDPHFAPATVAQLRDYVARGGLILSSPDNRSDDFTTSILTHWAPLVFDNTYKPRELPEDHALFTLWGKLSAPPKLESISNGVRELWVHSRSDLGATWHGRRLNTRDQWTFAANLMLYTTGRDNPRALGGPPAATAPATTQAMQLARVNFGGNWNPEPMLAQALQAQARGYGMDLKVIDATPAELDAATTPMAYLTGAGAIVLTDEQVAALKKYMDAGGMLVVDAAGGDPAFVKSFTELIGELTPGMKLQELPLNHPIYNGAIRGSIKTAAAHFRKGTSAPGQNEAPRLAACMDEFGRPRLIFSADDLTCGVAGITTWGILGYDRVSARAVMRNLIVYAAHGGRTPETGPSAPSEASKRETPGQK